MKNLHISLVFICLFSELWAYKNFTVENPSVCSLTSKKTIKLGPGTDSSILITTRHLTNHKLRWDRDYKCSFEIKGREYFAALLNDPIGIFAVIQSMKLRRDPVTLECVDYIQFKDSHGRSSLRLCGNFDAQHAMNSKFDPEHTDDSDEDDSDDYTAHSGEFLGQPREVSLLTFDDPYGTLTVHIFVDAKPLQQGEVTDFAIAFTGYKHCRHAGFKMCVDDRAKCIYDAFFNDGIVNCPYYDCVDEDGCKSPLLLDVDKPLSIGSHILIGSATSLVVSFIVFVLCLYMCRKYSKFCWSDDFARPQQSSSRSTGGSTHANAQHSNNAQVAPSVAETVNLHTPAVPSAPLAQEDKDMPPSYESLFPQGGAR